MREQVAAAILAVKTRNIGKHGSLIVAAAMAAVFLGSGRTGAQQVTVSGCSDLVTADRTLDREISDLNAPGPRGNSRLCLLHRGAEDVYNAAILRTDSLDQFRAAKSDAQQQLTAAGVDVCRIGRWEVYGLPPPALRPDDRLDAPVECVPRVVPLDDGAQAMLADVQSALTDVSALTTAQMGWRPVRPLTVLVFTSLDSGMMAFKKYTTLTDDDIKADLPENSSRTVAGTVAGPVILLNRIAPTSRTPAQIRSTLSHEYTHFVQAGIVAGAVPQWFLEGQADYQQVRNGGVSQGAHFFTIARLQADGKAPKLADIERDPDYEARRLSDGTNAVYGESDAAVSYLVERYGFDATVALLRGNRFGTLDSFDASLGQLVSQDLSALDSAVAGWLAAFPRGTARANDGRYHVDLVVMPDRTAIEMTVTFDQVVVCGAGQINPSAFRRSTGAVRPDGSFSFRNVFQGTETFMDGTLGNGAGASGTVRWTRADTSCDTGPIPFGGP